MGEHPLVRALATVGTALESVVDLDPVFVPTAEKARALLRVQRGLAQLEGLRLQLLASAEDVAEDRGARSAGAWLAHESRVDPRAGARDQRMADRLAVWPEVLGALRSGAIQPSQADVIVRALDALPTDLDSELVAKATARLLADAGHFDTRQLRVLGRRVLTAVAPDLAEAHEQAALEAEERRGRAETRLTFRPRGDGVTDVFARVPDQVADRLRTYLDAYTSPRRRHLADGSPQRGPTAGPNLLGDVELLPMPRRRGDAFCSLLEHIPSKGLPSHGGTATSVVVMIDHDQLVRDVGAAELSTGGQLSVSEVRRLACTAGILPAVLGGKGEVLDLGRTRRLYSSAQQKALAIRDRHCKAEDCTIPAAWCEAHHGGKSWSEGGKTNLDEADLLCGLHHHRVHDRAWRVERLANRTLRFHRRA